MLKTFNIAPPKLAALNIIPVTSPFFIGKCWITLLRQTNFSIWHPKVEKLYSNTIKAYLFVINELKNHLPITKNDAINKPTLALVIFSK